MKNKGYVGKPSINESKYLIREMSIFSVHIKAFPPRKKGEQSMRGDKSPQVHQNYKTLLDRAKEIMKDNDKLLGELSIRIQLTKDMTTKNKFIRTDCDAIIAGIFDTLQDAGVYEDDHMIKKVLYEEGEGDSNEYTIFVETM